MIINQKNLFELLKRNLPANPIIIEAGAFNGNDTKKLSLHWPQGIIHAFEPVPEIFAELKKQTEAIPNIARYPLALSNQSGPATFYVAEHPKKPQAICQAGSLLKPKDRLEKSPIFYPKTIVVPTITLDEWAQHHQIKNADFLWLDLQGHELAALQGASSLLETTQLVYVEINFIEAYYNQPTAHTINDWLEAKGFHPVAKDFEDEQKWFFGNILYQRKNNSA